MFKALYLKEYLKTRRAFAVCLILGLLFAAYAMLGINRVVATHGADHVWLIMLMKDQLFVDALKYFPPVIGLALGIVQMRPEMQSKRLRLTLHLPVSNNRTVMTMLSVGTLELLLIFGLQLAAVAVYYSGLIAPEMTARVVASMLPWYLAGFTAYFFSCAVCLEGRWGRRIVLSLMGAAFVCMFYFQGTPEAYNGMLAGAFIAVMLTAFLSIGSVDRFKQGLTD